MKFCETMIFLSCFFFIGDWLHEFDPKPCLRGSGTSSQAVILWNFIMLNHLQSLFARFNPHFYCFILVNPSFFLLQSLQSPFWVDRKTTIEPSLPVSPEKGPAPCPKSGGAGEFLAALDQFLDISCWPSWTKTNKNIYWICRLDHHPSYWGK